jgi:hypothetical protein
MHVFHKRDGGRKGQWAEEADGFVWRAADSDDDVEDEERLAAAAATEDQAAITGGDRWEAAQPMWDKVLVSA